MAKTTGGSRTAVAGSALGAFNRTQVVPSSRGRRSSISSIIHCDQPANQISDEHLARGGQPRQLQCLENGLARPGAVATHCVVGRRSDGETPSGHQPCG